MYYNDLEQSLYDFMTTLYPQYTVLFEPTNGPAVQSPFIGIQVGQMRQVGKSKTSTLANANREIEILAEYTVNVSVTFYGRESVNNTASAREAGNAAAEFYFNLQNSNRVEELLTQNKLSYISNTPFLPFRLSNETDWFTAHRTTVVFGFAVSSVEVVDTIETVVIHGEVTNPDNSSISVDIETTNP